MEGREEEEGRWWEGRGVGRGKEEEKGGGRSDGWEGKGKEYRRRSSEGKGDRAKGVEEGGGRIGLGAMKDDWKRRYGRRDTYPRGEMLQDEPELVSWNAPFVILIVFRSSSY